MLRKSFLILNSCVLTAGGYLFYQLKLGSFKGKGDIIEVKLPAQKLLYYEYSNEDLKSEVEVATFVDTISKKGVFGKFVKIQLDDPKVKKDATRYIIGKLSFKQRD